jgi:hypothetical protein
MYLQAKSKAPLAHLQKRALIRVSVSAAIVFCALAQLGGCSLAKKIIAPVNAAASSESASRPANATLAAATSTGAVPIAPNHPLVGNWRWKAEGNACVETWQYRSDGMRIVRAAEQVTRGRFEVTGKPSLLGFYRLQETVMNTNDRPDCSGDRPPAVGDSVLAYLQFDPALNQFIVCQNESLKACFGPFRREN